MNCVSCWGIPCGDDHNLIYSAFITKGMHPKSIAHLNNRMLYLAVRYSGMFDVNAFSGTAVKDSRFIDSNIVYSINIQIFIIASL